MPKTPATQADVLADLAATINREHELTYRAVVDALEHAILCGESLLHARATVPDGDWSRWVEHNLDMSRGAVQRYMRIATYRDHLLSAESRPTSINAAITYLRDRPVLSAHNGRQPTFDVDEAKRLRSLGMTFTDIGTVLGVSDVAVWRQLTPGATRRTIAYTNRVRARQRAERRALADQERTKAVARTGGKPADAYALLRRCALALDRALADTKNEDVRKALRDALTYTHRAEDAITRALGLE
jgi:Protein of unknown function (DUF3102)